MPTIPQCLLELDCRKTLLPRFGRDYWREQDTPSESYRQLFEKTKGYRPVVEWIKELADAQNPVLWNVFVVVPRIDGRAR